MDGSNRSRKQYKNNKKKDSKKGILICALQKNLLISLKEIENNINKVYNKNDMVNTKIGYKYIIYIFYLKKIDTILEIHNL